MSKSLIVILVIGFSASWFTDLDSDSVVLSLLLPVVDALALIALVIWIVFFLQARAKPRGEGLDTRRGDDGHGTDGD